MALHVRIAEDDQDNELLERGWKMAGFALWSHELFPNYFTKEAALAVQLSEYHAIDVEHGKLLTFVKSVMLNESPDVPQSLRLAAADLLNEMGYNEIQEK